ncbi:MAG: hypothetical protein JSU61_08870 [Fidelibacterota bacterium]|nr:MAG: hypothetical protein JSU61_08870 [Candidatus Neomarinimicrobiota bacterium]
MNRLRSQQRILSFLLLAGLCLALVTPIYANMRFFTNVMRNLQHYKVSGELVEFNLEGQGTGNLTFHLTLPSRRGNVEEVVMTGYLSTGYAIDRTGLKVGTVYVNAVIPSDDNRVVVTKTDAALLAQLIAQQIDPHKFLGKIEWIK